MKKTPFFSSKDESRCTGVGCEMFLDEIDENLGEKGDLATVW
jgi:hypothetical protein